MNFGLRFSIYLLFCIYAQISYSQIPGCTDPLATNFNSGATSNDGSCTYAISNYTPVLVTALDSSIFENSGLIYFNGQVWTHNDSGNSNEIYQVDSLTGIILRTITIGNASNIDWEGITQNSTHIFVGNFGNNNGNRTDLAIHKISKNDLATSMNDTVQSENITFSYSDQTSFIPAYNNNNFDCEAFIFANDSLHLFTKNWADLRTKHYVLPADSGNYMAILSDSFNVDGLITDATINDSGTVMLLGYKNIGGGFYTCFTWLLYDFHETTFFSGNKRRIEIGNALQLGQTEGITFSRGNSGWISSESIQSGPISQPAKLHSFNFNSFFSFPLETEFILMTDDKKIIVYPNFPADFFTVIPAGFTKTPEYHISNSLSQIIQSGYLNEGENIIHTESWEKGIYFFCSNGLITKLIKQ